MKYLVMILLVLIFSISGIAQESNKQKELGFAFNGFDHFGLTYKTGNDRALWRYSVIYTEGYNRIVSNEVNDNKNKFSEFGMGLKFGREFRKKLSEKLNMVYGIDLFLIYNRLYNEMGGVLDQNPYSSLKVTSIRPGASVVFGFNYIIDDHLVIGVELLPFVEYDMIKNIYEFGYGQDVENKSTGVYYGIESSSVLISLSYRF